MLPLSVVLLAFTTGCGGSTAAPAANSDGGSGSGSAPTPAPVNTAAPTIAGTAQAGQTLTVSTGTWSNAPTAYAYQWLRAGAAIAGATTSSYLLTGADVGSAISCTVTATNAGGSASATSAPTAIVTAAPSALPATVNYIAEGDSITKGFGASHGYLAYPAVAVGAAAKNPPVFYPLGGSGSPDWRTPAAGTENINGIVATSGITVTAGNGITGGFAGRGVYGGYDPSKALNLVSMMGGTNDGAVSNRVAIYRGIRGFVRQARARGYDRVVLGTIPSRASDANADGTFDGDTLPLNLDLRALWDSDLDADGLFDFAAHPRFATAAAARDAVYYADRLHPTDAGYAVMGTILTPVLDAAIRAPGLRRTAPATWSAFDKDPFLSLSDDRRTVSFANGFADANVRGLPGRRTGRFYFEIGIDDGRYVELGVVTIGYEGAGIYDNHLAEPQTSPYAAGLAVGWGTGGIFINRVQQAPELNGTRDVAYVAVDASARRLWMKFTGGSWNGSATADPASGTGGIDISGIGEGAIYPLGYIRAAGGRITSRFAAAQMTGPIPAGFTALA